MKNIYKIKLILLALVVFSSCAVDDDEPVQNLTSTIEASISSDLIIVPQTTTSYDLVVNLSQTLPSYSAKVEYTLSDGTTGTVISDGRVDEITIPVNLDGMLYEKVTLTSMVVLYAGVQGYEVTVSPTNSSVSIIRRDAFSVTMNWETASFNLDMFLVDFSDTWSPLAVLAAAAGATNSERIAGLLDFDGNFAIYVTQFNPYTLDVPYTLSFVTDGGLFNYDMTYTGTVGYSIWFNKTTASDGVVSYTFYEVDPS